MSSGTWLPPKAEKDLDATRETDKNGERSKNNLMIECLYKRCFSRIVDCGSLVYRSQRGEAGKSSGDDDDDDGDDAGSIWRELPSAKSILGGCDSFDHVIHKVEAHAFIAFIACCS